MADIKKGLNVRFSEMEIAEIEEAFTRLGLDTQSGLVRLCVVTFLREFKKHGEAILPPHWREIFEDQYGKLEGREYEVKKRIEGRNEKASAEQSAPAEAQIISNKKTAMPHSAEAEEVLRASVEFFARKASESSLVHRKESKTPPLPKADLED